MLVVVSGTVSVGGVGRVSSIVCSRTECCFVFVARVIMAYIKDSSCAVSVTGAPCMKIDETDFAILKSVKDLDRPLWKNKIHERITENYDRLPLIDSVSVQTVGRRVDALTEEEYLESVIISPEEIKRDLIIAFKLTEQGVEAVEQKAEQYLQETVQAEVFSDEDKPRIGKKAMLELMQEKFGIEEGNKEQLDTEYSRDELLTLLVIYYVRNEIVDAFTNKNVEELLDMVKVDGDLSEALRNYIGDRQPS